MILYLLKQYYIYWNYSHTQIEENIFLYLYSKFNTANFESCFAMLL